MCGYRLRHRGRSTAVPVERQRPPRRSQWLIPVASGDPRSERLPRPCAALLPVSLRTVPELKPCRSTPFAVTAGEIAATRPGLNWRVVAVFVGEFAPASKALGSQRTSGQSCLYRTARFMSMSAVAEPAERGKLGNLGEQRVDAVSHIANLQRSHSWRIDHPPATCNGVQRSRSAAISWVRMRQTSSQCVSQRCTVIA